MKVTNVEHIGIAVEHLEEAIQYYETILGLTCYSIEEVPDQKVRTAFFKIGEIKIELLEPLSDESTVAKFLEKKGPGLHHIAFAVNGLRATLGELQENDIKLIDREPRKGAEGLKVAFMHPKSSYGVLTELCENENLSSWGWI
jgi:methylmalonyl-CoA/ethylmalonyl-CoA epimerase